MSRTASASDILFGRSFPGVDVDELELWEAAFTKPRGGSGLAAGDDGAEFGIRSSTRSELTSERRHPLGDAQTRSLGGAQRGLVLGSGGSRRHGHRRCLLHRKDNIGR